MPTYIVTRARRGPRRRRYVVINRLEDSLPGRAAFLMNLARIRAAQLAHRSAEPGNTAPSGAAEAPYEAGPDAVGDERTPDAIDAQRHEETDEESPLEEWTKGELYDLARELDIAGRSKMNKGELLAAVRQHDSAAGSEQ